MGGVSRVSTPCTNSVFRGPLRVSPPSLLSRKERLSIVRQSLGLRRAMALGPCSAFLLVFSAVLTNYLSAADDCKPYTDSNNKFHFYQKCRNSFCCGNCYDRYCCSNVFNRFDEDAQDDCNFPHQDLHIPIMVIGIVGSIVFILIFVCCCVCPCCCLYKICRKPQPVIATTHHTIVTSVPGQYPQQPTVPAQSYQGAQPYPPYQPVPVQPGYGTHSMPAAVHQGPQFTPGPLPTYQEAIANPAYPPQPMPYSQAAFQPGQPPYPLQPPVCSNPTAPPAHSDYMAQPAYNPAFAAPPPKTG
ncbi:Protein shisa-4 [Oryzias melastigma]|uniref:Protein shisa-5 n=1 Tax=Oryzias melastigma TaxID=30732 RepID=A0A834L0J7_ORYME|nr:Protein shisa-4 [Oryzias melastigma]